MPETTKANPTPAPALTDTADLDSRVTALLDEMQQASDRMLRHLDHPGASGAAPADANPSRTREPPLQTLNPTPPPTPVKTPASDDLGKAVDQMIADAKAAGRRPAEVESLDRELATRGDDLIEGEIADESRVFAAAPPPTPPLRPPAPLATPTPPANTTAPVPPPPSAAPALAARPSPATATAHEPVPAGTRPLPAPATNPTAGLPLRRPSRASVVLLAGLASFSAPVAQRPHVRTLLGYLAVWTLFNAGCLLAYNFLVRDPSPPRAPAVDATNHEAPAREGNGSAGHDTAKKASSVGTHGSGDERDTPNEPAKAPPKSRSALPKKAAHGGGH